MTAASRADFEGELDRLYQLPLSEFTAARDELAKRLGALGDSEREQEIKKLRKPAAAVWLVNQLARERQLDVQRLLKAGESLTKSSQAQVAAGQSAQTFAEARRDEHRALEQLAKATREIAEREGIGSPAAAKATETLRAASLTAEGRELLGRGRLTEELEPPGFEALTGLEGVGRPLAPAKEKPPRSDDRAERQGALKQARERVRQLRAEERELIKRQRWQREKPSEPKQRREQRGVGPPRLERKRARCPINARLLKPTLSDSGNRVSLPVRGSLWTRHSMKALNAGSHPGGRRCEFDYY